MDAAEVFELPQDLVFVDLETTGGNADYHRITEVGIVRVEKGLCVEEWSSLVNPDCIIPSYIESFTGISNEMVAAAPRFADIATLVLEKLQSGALPKPVFVAHNARFDYSFLRAEFRRVDVNFCAKVLCTVKLSRRLFPQYVRHSLDALMERHDLACSARHRALGDARVISDFWFKLRNELPETALAAAAQTVLGAHKLPAHLPQGLADELPEGPGVYRFFGQDDVLLYVGRSNSIRAHVMSHFAVPPSGSKERKLGQLVQRIDWLQTAGELGAALREAEWIKTQRPLHNRHLKPATDGVTLRFAENTSAVELVGIADVEAGQLENCRGLFHSHKDARKALTDIAGAKLLCLKLLGLEESAGSCIAHQLGRCKGACVGKEPLILHHVRVQTALAPLKMKAWPFPGRVALRECNRLGDTELHVVDHWAYLGTARSAEELAALATRERHVPFDPAMYKILVRYFTNHPKPDWRDLTRPDAIH
jgi:DNA polymerase III subunit epsilon